MTYNRVCPRDLFNEANLLKCLGHLYLKTEDMPGVSWRDPQPGEPFVIDQDPASGQISCFNSGLLLSSERVHIVRALNSRDPWPVYCTHVGETELDEEVAVFTETGELTSEFTAVVAGQR